jgi:hypothetical protein
MRITSSEIRFASAHSEFSRFVQKETITERIRRPDREGPMRVSSREATDRDRPMLMSQWVQNPNLAEVSDRFEGRVSMIQRVVQEVESHRSSLVSAMEMDPVEVVVTENFEMSVEDKARVEMVIKAVVEQITGKKIDLVDPGKALKDGTVNDGSELFGARTGNGFAELAAGICHCVEHYELSGVEGCVFQFGGCVAK